MEKDVNDNQGRNPDRPANVKTDLISLSVVAVLMALSYGIIKFFEL